MRGDGTTFNYGLSSSTFDHLARHHDERRKEAERCRRAEEWLTRVMAGQVFYSFESVRYSAIKTFEVLRSRPCTDEERGILTAAARTLWCGLSETGRTEVRVVGSTVESVAFRAA